VRRSGRRTAALLVGSAVAAGVGVVLFAAPALASTGQVSVIEDDAHLEANPAATLERMRLLGADVVRVSVPWQTIAPDPSSAHVPAGFDAADPAAYPAAGWGLWDEIVTDARRDGITVDLDLMGGAPRWARGPGRPAGNSNPNWEPSPAAFGQFVRAIATRYSGSYDPALGRTVPGGAGDLPRVGFWSIWNEPNYGPSLAPQGVPGNLGVENSPRMYRQMLDAAWAALLATGHGPATDTILIGELAPRGADEWGVFSGMKPLVFLRALYCVSSAYRSLGGEAARIRGCPTTAAGSRRFRAQHPALFEATGVADHPYLRWYPPTVEPDPDPTNGSSTADYASLAVIGHLTGALDRLQRVYGSSRRLPVFDTEFGYITSPPKHSPDGALPLAGDRGVLHELVRVRQLAQPAHQVVRAVPDLRPRPSAPLERLGRLRERPAHLERRPEGHVRRLAPARVPADHVDAARAVARSLGVCPPRAVRGVRHRGCANGCDSVRPRFVAGVRTVHDDPDGDTRRDEQLLL
jgi:hypothetical protein